MILVNLILLQHQVMFTHLENQKNFSIIVKTY